MTSLALAASEAPLRAVKAKAIGVNQQSALIALREWAHTNPSTLVIPSSDMGSLLKRQRIVSKRKPEVLKRLTNAGIVTPSIGGHTVNREALCRFRMFRNVPIRMTGHVPNVPRDL